MRAHVKGASAIDLKVARVRRGRAQLEHGLTILVENIPHVRPDGALIFRTDSRERASVGHLWVQGAGLDGRWCSVAWTLMYEPFLYKISQLLRKYTSRSINARVGDLPMSLRYSEKI
jgi:hypothetical protein